MSQLPKRVWFLVVPRTGLLNIAGPSEVLGIANDVLGRRAYELELVGPSAPSAETRHGFVLGGLRPLPKTSSRLPDVVIVAGAPMDSPEVDAHLVPWLGRYHAR